MAIILLILPLRLYAQEQEREQVLSDDIARLSERALRDNVISEEERTDLVCFVRDSLPEDKKQKIKALEQIRDELDEKYAEKVRNAQKLLDEMGYIGNRMLPDRLYEPDDYVSPEEKRRKMEMAAIAGAKINKEELLKYVQPLPMKPWLRTVLRLLFGQGISQRPERWDYTAVPQMGRLYYILIPGGRPDDNWRDPLPMEYEPNPDPDKYYRR